jgi:hypothetical protein
MLLLVLAWLCCAPHLRAAVLLNEFMAINNATLEDEDGANSDWIELYNTATSAVPLAGWYLTDSAATLAKWQMPATNIPAGGYMIVFASDKDRRVPGAPLHTNFKLSGDGEYLGLVLPDGHTVAHAYTPAFPPQVPDVSYGVNVTTADLRYFTVPTPGAPNSVGTTNLGPVVRAVSHTPRVPQDAEALQVTARITDTRYGVTGAALVYRVMFNAETMIAMYDDGAHGDGAAGDSVFGATIPATAAGIGQMIRYFILATNAPGTVSRWPLAEASERYLGTVVADPAAQTNVPIYQIFVPLGATNWLDTDAGTTCVFFCNGELYDNVHVAQRGGWTSTQPLFKKRSHSFKFPDGHSCWYAPGVPRADNVNVNSMYNDQAYLREYLCWLSYRAVGVPGCTAFHVEMRLNGAFYCLGLHVEQVDDDFLERNGWDERGALYKAEGNGTYLYTTAGFEKKRPTDADFSDLQALVNGLNSGTSTDKERFAFDNVDMPELANFLAVDLAVQDVDSKHKNYYMYRATYGDGLWRTVSWDKDLSMGHVWDQAATNLQWNINWITENRLHHLLFDVPVFQQMFARRARSVLDAILQSPGTPTNALFYEREIGRLHDALKPLAEADRAKYGWPTNTIGYFHYPHYLFDAGVHELTNDYLRPRRSFMYNTYGWWLPAPQPATAALAFVTLGMTSTNRSVDYLELTNRMPYAVDISGWRLTGEVMHVFAPGVVVAAGRSLFVSPDVRAFRARAQSPKRGERRFVVGNYTGQLAGANGGVTLVRADGSFVSQTIPEVATPLALALVLAAWRRMRLSP